MINDVSAGFQQTNEQLLLTVSIVTFNPNFSELKKTLNSLEIALAEFPEKYFSITVVDNSPNDDVVAFLKSNYAQLPITLIHGQGNVGFGKGHNIAIQRMGEFHLILNPDIQLDADALAVALAFMRDNQNCGLLSPHASWPDGQRQYLCKRYPSILDLLLRGFAPEKIRALFSHRLARYEMRMETADAVYWNPPIVSGCFMLFRSVTLKTTGGFNDKYFLYFEDFDLALRSRSIADTAYVPTVRVVHAGGHASKKGIWHVKIFIRSAIKFYRMNGLKLF